MFFNSDLIPKDHFNKIKYRNLIEKNRWLIAR